MYPRGYANCSMVSVWLSSGNAGYIIQHQIIEHQKHSSSALKRAYIHELGGHIASRRGSVFRKRHFLSIGEMPLRPNPRYQLTSRIPKLSCEIDSLQSYQIRWRNPTWVNELLFATNDSCVYRDTPLCVSWFVLGFLDGTNSIIRKSGSGC